MTDLLDGKRGKKGFTLIEIMIVIAILGVLAVIALPQITSYRLKGYNAAAKADARNAFTAAQTFLTANPSGTVSSLNLQTFGFVQTDHVDTITVSGGLTDLLIVMRHSSGSKSYSVGPDGNITEF